MDTALAVGSSEPAGAPDVEIEITPAMLEAGLGEFCLFDRGDPLEWVIPAVYSAMEKARRG